ncbi:MAG TPA: tRNA 4-thiouridine(8) synthase ThiI, partial [Spirochaetia bacterium]|nr:tRNA 4-thiouridine(8) synthase ThiI [Spirochaetia bacterium]
GRGLLLLSGGIDSPVAGYLAAKRGMRLDAVHFHTYPVTSIAAQQKAQALGRLIGKWTGGMRFFNVPILEIQKRIQERARTPEYTLLFRAAMMRIASDIAEERGAIALITGESLGQVASQTAESMRFSETWSNLPVFRPLITWDKEEIMSLAKRLGTFRTAIMPFQDCCALFAPDHPLIHPKQAPMVESFRRLDLEELISAAREKTEVIELEPLLNPRTASKSLEASSVPHPAG